MITRPRKNSAIIATLKAIESFKNRIKLKLFIQTIKIWTDSFPKVLKIEQANSKVTLFFFQIKKIQKRITLKDQKEKNINFFNMNY